HSGFRASAREFLEAEGFDVVGEAADATSAIVAARALAPDVILLDIQLPDLNGVEAAKQIERRDGKPAIVLTSSRDVSYLAGALSDSPVSGLLPNAAVTGGALSALP